jgi:glycosyltransferase involved in cell wall biosynthesis
VKEDSIKISILVPVCNVEKYLEKCLNSIITQTLKDIEVIVIDDGSSDSSLKIINSYAAKDDRIVVISKPNSGYGSTMNLGIRMAKADYIGIVESDDWIDSRMYEILYGIAVNHSLDVVKSDFNYYWSLGDKVIKAGIMKKLNINEVIKPVDNLQVFHLPPSVWSALYRRSFLDENNIRFLESPGASYQDTGFAFKVWSSAQRVMLIDQAFVYYRQDNEQSSVNNKTKVFCVCDEWLEIENYLKRLNNQSLDDYSILLKFETYRWNLRRLVKPLNYEFLNRFRCEFAKKLAGRDLSNLRFGQLFNIRLYSLLKHPKFFMFLMGFESAMRWLLAKLVKQG